MVFAKDAKVFNANRPPNFFPSGKNITDWENHILMKVAALSEKCMLPVTFESLEVGEEDELQEEEDDDEVFLRF